MISHLDIGFMFGELPYANFREAVAAADRSDRTKRARADNLAISATQIVDYGIDESSIELLLSGRRILRIYCTQSMVDWQLHGGTQISRPLRRYANVVQLELPDNRHITWSPDALLQDRLFITGLSIAPTKSLVFLNVRNRPELMFGQAIERDGARILFFEEA